MEIDLGLLWPILVIQALLVITALVSLVRAERTNGPKWMWALIILFGSLLGAVLYFVIGRRND